MEVKRPAWAAVAAVIAAVLLWPVACTAQPDAGAREQASRMGRGVNILSDDPMWNDRAQARFQARHFSRIREGGFSTVRVVLHGFDHMDAQNRLDPNWLATLDWVVNTALANHLMVILDEHDFEPCGHDPVSCKSRLMAFWRQVADRYSTMPRDVMFEILNEPNGALTPAMWNDWLREALAIVRTANPKRFVILGPGFWNGFDHLGGFAPPANDPNIIVSVHYYEPMAFTHQGASWYSPSANLSNVTWGTAADIARLKRNFDRVQRWADANGRAIFLGEFGAYDHGPLADRVRYTAAVAREAEAHHWPWAHWQFDSDFIVYDIDRDRWVERIHKALVP